MDQKIEGWVSDLNIFGSDIEPDHIQEMLHNGHAAADPVFAQRLAEAREKRQPVKALPPSELTNG